MHTKEGTSFSLFVAALRVLAVQTLDIRVIADGLVADVVRLKVGAATAWARTLELTGLSAQEQLAALQQALQGLPGIGRNNATLLATAQAGVFNLVGAGALAGQSLPAITLGLSRALEQPPNYLLIGAANVNASVGTSSAGVRLTDLNVGLIVSRNTPPVLGGVAARPGYALNASGTASLYGFDSAITLNAAAIVQINTLGRAIDMSVKTGLTTPARQVSFADGLSHREITITSGTVGVAGLGNLTGSLKIVSTTQVADGVTVTDTAIGIDNLSGSLTPGGVGATLTHGRGGIVRSVSSPCSAIGLRLFR